VDLLYVQLVCTTNPQPVEVVEFERTAGRRLRWFCHRPGRGQASCFALGARPEASTILISCGNAVSSLGGVRGEVPAPVRFSCIPETHARSLFLEVVGSQVRGGWHGHLTSACGFCCRCRCCCCSRAATRSAPRWSAPPTSAAMTWTWRGAPTPRCSRSTVASTTSSSSTPDKTRTSTPTPSPGQRRASSVTRASRSERAIAFEVVNPLAYQLMICNNKRRRGPRGDALCQLKSGQLLNNSTKNHILKALQYEDDLWWSLEVIGNGASR